MDGISFTGQADFNLDAKHRLTVPARYRERLSGGATVAKDIEPCVAIWPTADYATFCESVLAGEHPMSQRGRSLRQYLWGNSYAADLDASGRLALQPFLLEHADMEREVTVVGVGDHLQVWNREGWKRHNDRLAADMASITEHFDTIA